LPRKCVKRQRLITNNDLHTTTAECDGKSLPPEPGFPLFFLPSGSRFLCENSISIIDTWSYFCQRTSQILLNKSQDTHL
jgi:hypothetical protein